MQHPLEIPMLFLCILFVVFMAFSIAMDD
jgi:hypothetical protein